ncbi:hypothetical protein ACJJTC_005613 [Scirpophaga incertulas]
MNGGRARTPKDAAAFRAAPPHPRWHTYRLACVCAALMPAHKALLPRHGLVEFLITMQCNASQSLNDHALNTNHLRVESDTEKLVILRINRRSPAPHRPKLQASEIPHGYQDVSTEPILEYIPL